MVVDCFRGILIVPCGTLPHFYWLEKHIPTV